MAEGAGGRVGTVAELWRYPVKSMQGERLERAVVTPGGLVGDRAFALLSGDDGKVVSAKNPRKWGRLLEVDARFVDEPGPDPEALPPVAITLPDGAVTRSDAPDVDDVLTAYLGRAVHLASAAPEAAAFEEVWPDVEGLAPEAFIESTKVASEVADETVSDITVAMAAPPGAFFDLTTLHLMTTGTLEALRAARPAGDFDVRRFRPNVLVASETAGFVENDWVGCEVGLGAEAAMRVDLPTMRCIMTTLAQPGLDRDPATLGTVAASNRLRIGGGDWACAGSYGSVAAAGTVRVGDDVRLRA